MNIVIVGCGRVGAELAYRLFQKGHHVAVVDQVASALNNLPTDFRGRTIHGEALAADVLRRAGIEQADGLAAVTNSDTLNAVVAHVARTVYCVPQVVVRNYHPRWRILHETFGLQVVSSTSWGAQRIEELLYPALARCVFSAGNGEVEIYELSVTEAWRGRTLRDLLHPGQCLAVALTRAGKAMLPSLEEPLETGDILHLSSTMEGIETLRERLKTPQGG
ncbi:MAG: portal protein [Candidatus Methylomirabilota bacterium]|nr:NAD-binding protein [Candidatus Methylomirabilis sp.]NJD67740.1 TrkA family potassium uptake protein [candidate division NC10 bacterium]PWB47775.1 MAG: portal protein [candidate division NC10 bacterium]